MTPQWLRRHSGPQWIRAKDILNTAPVASPEVVWACGPYLAQHASTIATVWSGRRMVGNQCGGTMERGGMYAVNGGRITFTEVTDEPGAPRRTRFVVPVRDVELLISDRNAMPGLLVAAIDAVLAERREVTEAQMDHNQRYLIAEDPPTRAERDAWFERYAGVEHRCRDVAADLWEHVRPAPAKPVQLSLFDLAGAR